MKVLLINPVAKKIETIEIDSQNEITDLIGYDTIISDDVGSNGDKLFFDEECFLRGTEGRFQIDKLIPVSGNGVIIGSRQDGSLQDVQTEVADLTARVQFL